MVKLMSARLRMEPLVLAHAREVFSPLQDPDIYTFLPEDPPTREALDRRYAFLEGGKSPDGSERWLNWVAFLRGGDTPIGTFQATLPQGEAGAIAYVIFPRFWRQGYAREMAASIVRHLFATTEVPSLYAEIDTRNTGSIRLAQTLGMTRTVTTYGADFFKGASSDEHTYVLTREGLGDDPPELSEPV